MSAKTKIDSVGWIFFGMMLAIALGPCIYAVLKITNDSITIGMRVGTGIIVAVFAAAFASWAVNSLLQLRATPETASTPDSGENDDVASPTDAVPRSELKPKAKQTKKKKKK